MTAARSALVLAALLQAPPAFAEEAVAPSPEPRREPVATLDLSLGLGSGTSTGESEPQLNAGLQLTARPGPAVLAGNVEVATNYVGSIHLFLTGGVGTWKRLQAGRVVLLGLCGLHTFNLDPIFGEQVDHDLPVLGARAAWELDAGRWVMGRASIAASGYVDLRREYDASVARDVGGVTVLLSLALGLGV